MAPGRPVHDLWGQGDFEKLPGNRAKCVLCGQEYQSGAIERLSSHRTRCPRRPQNNVQSDLANVDSSNGETTSAQISTVSGINSGDPPGESSKVIQQKSAQPMQTAKKRKGTSGSIDNFLDRISDKEQKEIDEAFGKMVYACNIPMDIVESTYFIRFTSMLRPSWKPPIREILENTLLHTVHESIDSLHKGLTAPEGILIILKSIGNPEQCDQLLAIVETSKKEQLFIKSWDIWNDSEAQRPMTQVSEITWDAKDSVEEKYKLKIHSILLQNPEMMVGLERLDAVPYFISQTSWVEVIALKVENSLLSEELDELWRELEEQGVVNLFLECGKKFKLPPRLESSSLLRQKLEMYSLFNKHGSMLKQFVGEGRMKLQGKIKLLFNPEFGEDVRISLDRMKVLKSIAEKCQNPRCTNADIVEDWLLFEKKFQIESSCIEELLSAELLTLNFVDHKYRGSLFVDNRQRMQKMQRFVLQALEDEGLDSYELYKSNVDVFNDLSKAKMKSSAIYWKFAEPDHKELARMILKVIQVPVKVDDIHLSEIPPNKLTPMRQQKLTQIHHQLRIRDKKMNL